jgi:uncharacterized OB-fold protein
MAGDPPMEAARYADGTISYPAHPAGPDGSSQVELIDLAEHTAEVVTWTTSYATPPGVRKPNTVAIVEFDIDGVAVRAIGGTTAAVSSGETVRPVYVSELRTPDDSLKSPEAQAWDGYRFEPIR